MIMCITAFRIRITGSSLIVHLIVRGNKQLMLSLWNKKDWISLIVRNRYTVHLFVRGNEQLMLVFALGFAP